ncbi:hypothetical protein GCM10010309_64440 [Streptomyces violaceochromogenes]|nr:hypothetical protein GCM10010309_64440 [Streptomyces violaceochromogenes]
MGRGARSGRRTGSREATVGTARRPVNTLHHTFRDRPEVGAFLVPEGLLAGLHGASFANRFDEVILPASLRSFRTSCGDELPHLPAGDVPRSPCSRTDSTSITHPLSSPGRPGVRAADRFRPAGTAYSRIEDAIHAIR